MAPESAASEKLQRLIRRFGVETRSEAFGIRGVASVESWVPATYMGTAAAAVTNSLGSLYHPSDSKRPQLDLAPRRSAVVMLLIDALHL